MLGMPAERHLTLGSNSGDPAMRDFRMTSHLARYSGVSFGASAGRPSRPSSTSTGRGGGTPPVFVPAAGGGTVAAGAAAAARARAWPNGSIGAYTPVKSGLDVPCARSDAVETTSRHRSAAVFAMVFSLVFAHRLPTTVPSARLTRVRRPVWLPSFAG